MKQTMKQTIKNYVLFLVGLFIASMGVALSTKAGLGTSPVAAVPYSVSIVNHGLVAEYLELAPGCSAGAFAS